MSLEAILLEINTAGDVQVAQVEAHARAQVEAVLAQARQEADRARANTYNDAVAPAAEERYRLLHRASLEALQITGSLREALVDEALEQARRRLAGLRAQAEYREVLSHLAQEALAEIHPDPGKGPAACVQIDRRDRPLMNGILAALGLDLPVQEDLDCWGGLVVCSADGRVVITNTLEARMERAAPSLRRSLSGLFEAEECQTSTTAMPACTP